MEVNILELVKHNTYLRNQVKRMLTDMSRKSLAANLCQSRGILRV